VAAPLSYFEIEVSVMEIRPRIWRRFLLRTTSTFKDLHEAIQDSFGWGRCHLWEFRPSIRSDAIAGVPVEVDDPASLWDEVPTPDAKKVRLTRYFNLEPGVQKCLYIYDFGDSWHHEVKVRKVVMDESKFKQRLLAGARACPPEDCGGTPGYEECLEVLAGRPEGLDDDQRNRLEWLGDWSPEAFDLEMTRKEFDR